MRETVSKQQVDPKSSHLACFNTNTKPRQPKPFKNTQTFHTDTEETFLFNRLHANLSSTSFSQKWDDRRLATTAYRMEECMPQASEWLARQVGKGIEQVNLLLNSQQMPDLSLKAGQSCLVNAVLGNQKFIFQSQRQFCQINISIKAEIQGLEIRTSSRQSQVLSCESRKCEGYTNSQNWIYSLQAGCLHFFSDCLGTIFNPQHN